MKFFAFFRLLQEELRSELPAYTEIQLIETKSGSRHIFLHTPADVFSPLIPLDPLFSAFREGASLYEIGSRILKIYAMETIYPLCAAEDFPGKKAFLDGLSLKPVSMQHSTRYLQTLPHYNCYKIAFFFMVHVPNGCEMLGDAPVSFELLRHFGLSSGSALSAALRNLQYSSPAVILPLHDYLETLSGSDQAMRYRLSGSASLLLHNKYHVLTTRNGEYGANALLYPGLPEELYRSYGEYYLLPSSVHELLLLPKDKTINPSELRFHLRRVNRSLCHTMMVLSDDLLAYDPQNGLHVI